MNEERDLFKKRLEDLLNGELASIKKAIEDILWADDTPSEMYTKALTIVNLDIAKIEAEDLLEELNNIYKALVKEEANFLKEDKNNE
jgi:hypothetical protein